MVSGLGGALDTERLPTVKTETQPKHEMHTGDTTVGRPHVKSELYMPGNRGREQRCPSGFEGVTPIPYSYAAEVGHVTSATQRQHSMTREVHQGSEPPCSRKNFLDEAVLIGYDGTNMPYVMFYNQIMNLLNRCYYSDRKLALLLLFLNRCYYSERKLALLLQRVFGRLLRQLLLVSRTHLTLKTILKLIWR